MASKVDTRRLSALINALGDLTTDIHGLYARLSLRSDVYGLIRESDESTDKFESAVIQCSWTNHEILIALVKRIETYFDNHFDEEKLKALTQREIAQNLCKVFVPRMEGTRCWNGAPIYRVIMSLTRRRPRDMVKLCINAAQSAYEDNSNIIRSQHIVQILEGYSSDRMTDLINEFSSEMPALEKLVYNMGPTVKEMQEKTKDRYTYTTEQLYQKIKNITENVNLPFAYNPNPDIHDIAHFLYKIGFITARKELMDGKIDRYYYDEKKQLLRKHIGDQGFMWEIHPAYRGALARNRQESWEETVNFEQD